MRSSKSRSRSKSNRSNNNRQVGNIVNRVFDSSGPEGKVRGTPQQIIEKYDQLARDAQVSGDRVATENFQQHAEHYTRMLAEAMREQAERQAQQQQHQQNTQNNSNQNNNPNNNQPGNTQQGNPQQGNPPKAAQDRQGDQPQGNQRRQDRGPAPVPSASPEQDPNRTEDRKPKERRPAAKKPEEAKSSDVIDVHGEADAGLVETPENKPQKPKRTRKKAVTEPVVEETSAVDTAPPDAAE